MPWCEECSRFYNPNSVESDATCPRCGRPLARASREGGAEADPVGDQPVRAPWHFWVLVAAVVTYLGWRALQGVGWVLERML
ncbi:hypothetical protein BH24ACT3_BH24ACT3_06270 [soil metagenome]